MKLKAVALAGLLAISTTITFAQQSAGVLLPIRVSNASANAADMALATDGNPNTNWNALGNAPQWIEIDLGSERMFSILRMLPAQFPSGKTTHNIYGRNNAGVTYSFGNIEKYTSDSQWIEYNNIQEIPVRYLTIQTTQSPSWIAWREFEVYDGGELREACHLNDPFGYGWAVYAVQTGAAQCAGYQMQYLFKYRDFRNQRSGTIVRRCTLKSIDGWEFIGTDYGYGRCPGFQGNEIYTFRRK